MDYADPANLEQLHDAARALAVELGITEAVELIDDFNLQFNDGFTTRDEAHSRLFRVYASLKEVKS